MLLTTGLVVDSCCLISGVVVRSKGILLRFAGIWRRCTLEISRSLCLSGTLANRAQMVHPASYLLRLEELFQGVGRWGTRVFGLIVQTQWRRLHRSLRTGIAVLRISISQRLYLASSKMHSCLLRGLLRLRYCRICRLLVCSWRRFAGLRIGGVS